MTDDLDLLSKRNKESEAAFTAVSASSGRGQGLTFRGLELSRFERQLITGNRCGAFLDMKCVFHNDSTDIIYDTERFIRLDDVLSSGITDLDTVLSLCRAFLEALWVCGDYLVSSEDLSFKNENIYCARDLSSIRFMYVPGYRNHMSIRDKLVDILDTAIEYDDGRGGTVAFLSDFKNRLYTGGKDLRALNHITEEMIRRNAPDRGAEAPHYGEEAGKKRRARGMAVRFAAHGDVLKAEEKAGGPPGFLRQESSDYGKKGGFQEKKKDGSKDGSGLGAMIKNLFNELVS